MSNQPATAISCSNIAFIKYWGNLNHDLRLAINPSLSMNLADLTIKATVEFDPTLETDTLLMNKALTTGKAAQRVFDQLDIIRAKANITTRAKIVTESNFPIGAGIASSAAAFSALAVAGSKAAGLNLSEVERSILARRGSGSACRSIPNGYCEWLVGETDKTSYSTSVAPATHWDLRDLVAIVSTGHKKVGSTGGHALAGTSVLQQARIDSATDRFKACKEALLNKDLATMGPIIEEDAIIMHGVMMSSRPPLFYWTPATLAVIEAVYQWREEGLPVYFTIDAGPNVHLICEAKDAEAVEAATRALPDVQDVLKSKPGGSTQLIT